LKIIKRIIKKYISKVENRITDEIISNFEYLYIANKLQNINLNSHDSILDGNREIPIIVSLTTFGNRIKDVYLTIESIAKQTMKPSKIILWLNEDEFSLSDLPISLLRLQNRGLTIDFCKNYKSYKKLIPTLKKWNDDIIITIDDDAIYNWDLIEVLYKNHLQNPNLILCGIAKRMDYTNNDLTEYNNWEKNTSETFFPSKLNLAIGIGGVLYFPGCFYEDVSYENKFMNLAPYADDLWFKVMSLLKGVKVKCVGNDFSTASKLIPLKISLESSLSIINVINKKNDIQLRNILIEYDAYKLLTDN
jgi:hypothetical protein